MTIKCLSKYNKYGVQEGTTKNFYTKYFYKLVFTLDYPSDISHIYGLHHHDYSIFDVKDQIQKRERWRRSYSTRHGPVPDDEAEVKNDIVRALWDYRTKLRLRSESSRLSVFFETEQQIEEFLRLMSPTAIKRLVCAFYPLNNEIQTLVKDGYVILKRPIAQKYLVNIKEGSFTLEETTRLHDYLKNVDAKLSEGLAYKLTNLPDAGWTRMPNDRQYFNNMRFYVHDQSHAEFIHLMMSKVRMKIQEVKVMS